MREFKGGLTFVLGVTRGGSLEDCRSKSRLLDSLYVVRLTQVWFSVYNYIYVISMLLVCYVMDHVKESGRRSTVEPVLSGSTRMMYRAR